MGFFPVSVLLILRLCESTVSIFANSQNSEGIGRMTIFASESTAQTINYQPGDVSYIPASFGALLVSTLAWIEVVNDDLGHYIENIGNTTLKFLEVLNTGQCFLGTPG